MIPAFCQYLCKQETERKDKKTERTNFPKVKGTEMILEGKRKNY